MLSRVFLGASLIGAEWVLYILVLLSILSIALIFERLWFYREASRGLPEFRAKLRALVREKKWTEAVQLAQKRRGERAAAALDLESEMAVALLAAKSGDRAPSPEVLTELAQDPVLRAKLGWEKSLSLLATIGSNSPFIGLFGTVLGIMKAFHDLSQQVAGAQAVTAGISEALVATAVGLLVAIPAVIAFNLFQRRVKSAVAEAEALKSFLVGQLSE